MNFSHRLSRQLGAVKKVFLFLLVVIAGLGVVYGPELFGALRFVESIEQQAADLRASHPGRELSLMCTDCHGPGGNSISQYYPQLAGQTAEYTRNQLSAFASGERQSVAMNPLAATLSEQDIEQLAEYFAQEPALANDSFNPDAELVALGEAKASMAGCAACHGLGLVGEGNNPRLAGQGYRYLVTQLTNFRDGKRRDKGGIMMALSASLTDQEIIQLAQYMVTR